MLRFLLTTCIILGLSSCQKQQFDQVEVIGHAGAGLDMTRVPFHGNTKESLEFALQLGTKYVEIDVQLTKDQQWVLFHDDFLEQTTNLVGCVHDYSLQELQEGDYQGLPKAKIMSLAELETEAFKTWFLDFRHYKPCQDYALLDTSELILALPALIEKFPMGSATIVNRNPAVLVYMEQKGFAVAQEVESYAAMLQSHESYGFDHFWIRNELITENEVAQAKKQGFVVTLTNLRSHSANKRAIKKMPNFVVTDALSSALSIKST